MSEPTTKLIGDFFASFKAEQTSITDRLNAPQPDIGALQLDVARLRKRLVDATEYLPTYDQRQYNAHLNALETDIQAKRDAVAPKARFGFKRKEGARPSAPAAAPSPSPAHVPVVRPLNENVLKLYDTSDAYIDSTSFAVPAGPVELSLSGLSSCIVNLRESVDIASVHGKDLRRIILLLPQIQGSILLDGCSECIVVVACHQFRMHTTTDTDVYLHIGSMPVIEHSKRIRFAPYPFDGLSNDIEHAIQDFDWILPGPSPNWSRMDEQDRVALTHWPMNHIDGGAQLHAVLDGLLPRKA